MTTTEYFPILPLGEGTVEIEALGSLLCRMAKDHSVSVFALATHLRTWWKRRNPDDTRAGRNAVNAMNPMFCGTGSNVEAFVEMLTEGTGCRILDRTTFLALRTVISSYGHGVCRLGRAWCPACLEEATQSDAPFYDRLIWAIPTISRCSIHRLLLETLCPQCGAFQSHYHHRGEMTLCFRCKASLRHAPTEWKTALEPTMYERECHHLVEAISSGSLLHVVPDAYNLFLKEIVDHVSTIRREFGQRSHIATVIRCHTARDTGHPKLSTLLKRCALLGTNPADVLRDPVGTAKSINLLSFAQIDVPVDRKPRRPEHLIDLAEQRLKAELKKTDFDSMPSLVRIAKDLGVSKGFMRYRLESLCAEYGRHRRHCGKLKHIAKIRRATEYLLSGPILSYPSLKYPSHDHLVADAVSKTGVGVHVARLAVDAALKRQLGHSAYFRYRKANGLHNPRPSKATKEA